VVTAIGGASGSDSAGRAPPEPNSPERLLQPEASSRPAPRCDGSDNTHHHAEAIALHALHAVNAARLRAGGVCVGDRLGSVNGVCVAEAPLAQLRRLVLRAGCSAGGRGGRVVVLGFRKREAEAELELSAAGAAGAVGAAGAASVADRGRPAAGAAGGAAGAGGKAEAAEPQYFDM
jgi:hypothetical protein